jgi:hypothetical protein
LTDAKEAARKKNESLAEAQRLKKEKKAMQNAASKARQVAGASDQPDFTKMDIRVGEIVKVRSLNDRLRRWTAFGTNKTFLTR